MASVSSLGVHRPTGLAFAIQEQILPPEPAPSSYSWEIQADPQAPESCEDELLTTDRCVVWSRGGLFRKAFRFDLEQEPVTQALLTYFPASDDGPSSSNGTARLARGKTGGMRNEKKANGRKNTRSDGGALSRALVVFLKTQAHIYFLSGASHVVHMPFEVETACAAPRGVVIQRKAKMDSTSSVSLRFPRVPPNSFVSALPPPSSSSFSASRGPQTGATASFSTEGLGKPKTLPLRLSSTLENMWQPPLESSDSRWPRIVCLTDPLLELGLVVAQLDKPRATTRARRNSARSPFLDPAEEIIHVESIPLPKARGDDGDDDDDDDDEELILAVTVNREANMYTVWKLAYLPSEDVFTARQQKDAKRRASRRRSSVPPGLTSGAATPFPVSSMRESFGAALPGKKQQQQQQQQQHQQHQQNKPPPLDTALSSLDPDKGGEVTRRQSRRVSSLLARADLSASQDRTSFVEQPLMSSHGHGRRLDSHGSQRGRASGGGAVLSHSLNSLAEAPVDTLLDELRAGGDFEGFHSMGLDDHELDGLAREMTLTRIYSVPTDNSNVRYSLSDKPARDQCKVFVVVGGPCATDELGKRQLIVGIQDPLDKRLQLLTLSMGRRGRGGTMATFAELRRAQSVVDSCRVMDGGQSMILILSEDKAGQRELSLQAPWSQMATVVLPLLLLDNVDSLDYAGRHANKRWPKSRRSATSGGAGIGGAGIPSAHIKSLCHAATGGAVDIFDRDDTAHRVCIQLEPRAPQVRRVLDACRSVLPAPYGEKMVSGWWHVSQWRQQQLQQLQQQKIAAGGCPEWSSLTILLFAFFLTLDPGTQEPSAPGHGATSSWAAMLAYEAPDAAAFPPWMQNRGWQWMLDEGALEPRRGSGSTGEGFISAHVSLARQFLASPSGQSALGPHGALATAAGRPAEDQRSAARSVLLALHLLLEEQKLNIMTSEDMSPGQPGLRAVLGQLARWLGWGRYVALYDLGLQAEIPDAMYCVYEWIQTLLTKRTASPFLTLPEVYATAAGRADNSDDDPRRQVWRSVTPRTLMFADLLGRLGPASSHRQMVEAMHACGFAPRILESLPEGIAAPLQDAVFRCQPSPPASWPDELVEYVGRSDISRILKPQRGGGVSTPSSHQATWDFHMLCQSVDDYTTSGYDEGEGTERQTVVRALFQEDRRLNEAQNLLATHRSRAVRLDPRPEWSESEYLDRQKALVAALATGTLAIPAGRGLLYYGLRFPLPTQRFHIGGFNLTCVVRPGNVAVGVDKAQCTEDKISWAFFHQGVAGGLAISPRARGIDTSWILYNKPGQDLGHRHAGFLLALGLNGHLRSVARWVAFKYLTPKHTMTSVGLLLGLAASHVGSMDSLVTRLLSVHVTRMLPRGAAELNLSRHTQTAGVMGLGLVFCGSQHRRMSEILLSEVEHAADAADEDPLRDEAYRLAAGFALGLVNLARGPDLRALRDLRLPERLLAVATAAKRVELVHVLDRSAAAAAVAVALVFLKSEDAVIARKIDVPDSVLQFDYARPDLLLLRTLAKNLILWSRIRPDPVWIRDGLPPDYRPRYRLDGVDRLRSRDLPFFCILAGLCFALALRFAGSARPDARDLLLHYLDQFARLERLPPSSFDAEMARGTVRMCVDLLSLCAATVMAGTGDIAVLRRLRALHGREDSATPYGSHLAAHLAVGALFLGCGTATLGTGDLAVASLLVAFYPLFPAHIQDNRAHLQALRHFWVLAVDPRCLVVKDAATGQPISVPVVVRLQRGSETSDTEKVLRQTPCLLPPLQDVVSVRTDASALGYWDLEIDFATRPDLAAAAFRANQSLHLRRRPAHEEPFQAALRALGRDALALDAATAFTSAAESPAESRNNHNPLEWAFRLPALAGLTHAERALVLDRPGSAGLGGGVGEGEGATTAVDARLVLETAADGWSRDQLLGLRLLFAWADTRSLLPVLSLSSSTRARALLPPEKEKGKAKKVLGGARKGKGKKKVEVEVEANAEAVSPPSDAHGGEANGWWMRDGVVEMLKGRVWLAGRK